MMSICTENNYENAVPKFENSHLFNNPYSHFPKPFLSSEKTRYNSSTIQYEVKNSNTDLQSSDGSFFLINKNYQDQNGKHFSGQQNNKTNKNIGNNGNSEAFLGGSQLINNKKNNKKERFPNITEKLPTSDEISDKKTAKMIDINNLNNNDNNSNNNKNNNNNNFMSLSKKNFENLDNKFDENTKNQYSEKSINPDGTTTSADIDTNNQITSNNSSSQINGIYTDINPFNDMFSSNLCNHRSFLEDLNNSPVSDIPNNKKLFNSAPIYENISDKSFSNSSKFNNSFHTFIDYNNNVDNNNNTIETNNSTNSLNNHNNLELLSNKNNTSRSQLFRPNSIKPTNDKDTITSPWQPSNYQQLEPHPPHILHHPPPPHLPHQPFSHLPPQPPPHLTQPLQNLPPIPQPPNIPSNMSEPPQQFFPGHFRYHSFTQTFADMRGPLYNPSSFMQPQLHPHLSSQLSPQIQPPHLQHLTSQQHQQPYYNSNKFDQIETQNFIEKPKLSNKVSFSPQQNKNNKQNIKKKQKTTEEFCYNNPQHYNNINNHENSFDSGFTNSAFASYQRNRRNSFSQPQKHQSYFQPPPQRLQQPNYDHSQYNYSENILPMYPPHFDYFNNNNNNNHNPYNTSNSFNNNSFSNDSSHSNGFNHKHEMNEHLKELSPLQLPPIQPPQLPPLQSLQPPLQSHLPPLHKQTFVLEPSKEAFESSKSRNSNFNYSYNTKSYQQSFSSKTHLEDTKNDVSTTSATSTTALHNTPHSNIDKTTANYDINVSAYESNNNSNNNGSFEAFKYNNASNNKNKKNKSKVQEQLNTFYDNDNNKNNSAFSSGNLMIDEKNFNDLDTKLSEEIQKKAEYFDDEKIGVSEIHCQDGEGGSSHSGSRPSSRTSSISSSVSKKNPSAPNYPWMSIVGERHLW